MTPVARDAQVSRGALGGLFAARGWPAEDAEAGSPRDQGIAAKLQAPGPPCAPMSFLAVPRDGGEQASLSAASGFHASIAGEPRTTLKSPGSQAGPANTGLKVILPSPVKPPCTSE